MSSWTVWALVATATLAVCWLIPWLAMRALVPSLESGPRVENYRGAPVFPGLGIVWVFWIGGFVLLLVGVIVEDALSILPEPIGSLMSDEDELMQLVLIGYAFGALMAIPTFVFGLIDDVYGGAEHKGFRGHIKALLHGRLTTGGLKMAGIGIASAFVSLVIGAGVGTGGVRVALSFLVIPLAANFVNLVDLRPLRALKVYSAIVILVAATVPMLWMQRAAAAGLAAAVVLIITLGPVAAVWGYDAREQGMLGDAGANPAGAVAGVMIALWWPTWAVCAAVVVLLVLNLASERVSFSSVIEGNRALSWLDRSGRSAPSGKQGT